MGYTSYHESLDIAEEAQVMGNLNQSCLWPNCECKTEKGEPCKFENPDFYIDRERSIKTETAKTKPIVTTLCGSTRFPDAFALVNMHLTMLGRIVIGLGMMGHADVPVGARFLTSDGDESTPEKQGLDQLHFRKIDISDGIFVVNPGGYIGSSTKREVAYATRTGKTVEYLFTPKA